jgi:hypothetical protein
MQSDLRLSGTSAAFFLHKNIMGMERPFAILPVCLVVLLRIMESASMALAGEAEVLIWNDLRSLPIKVDCDTQKPQWLRFGETFKWTSASAWFSATRYVCNFIFGRYVQTVPVWIAKARKIEVPYTPSVHCVWHVTKNGFFVHEAGEPIVTHAYRWLGP